MPHDPIRTDLPHVVPTPTSSDSGVIYCECRVAFAQSDDCNPIATSCSGCGAGIGRPCKPIARVGQPPNDIAFWRHYFGHTDKPEPFVRSEPVPAQRRWFIQWAGYIPPVDRFGSSKSDGEDSRQSNRVGDRSGHGADGYDPFRSRQRPAVAFGPDDATNLASRLIAKSTASDPDDKWVEFDRFMRYRMVLGSDSDPRPPGPIMHPDSDPAPIHDSNVGDGSVEHAFKHVFGTEPGIIVFACDPGAPYRGDYETRPHAPNCDHGAPCWCHNGSTGG